METSRIIRVGTRNYIIRVAAVLQEHVLVCITRNRHGPTTWFFGGIEFDLVDGWVVEIEVISVWGVGGDMILV